MPIIGAVAITFASCSMPYNIGEDDSLMQMPNRDVTSWKFCPQEESTDWYCVI